MGRVSDSAQCSKINWKVKHINLNLDKNTTEELNSSKTRESSIPLNIWRQTGKFTECNAKLTMLIIINNSATIKHLLLSSIQ